MGNESHKDENGAIVSKGNATSSVLSFKNVKMRKCCIYKLSWPTRVITAFQKIQP